MLQTIGKFVPCPNEILMRNKTYIKIDQSSKSKNYEKYFNMVENLTQWSVIGWDTGS